MPYEKYAPTKMVKVCEFYVAIKDAGELYFNRGDNGEVLFRECLLPARFRVCVRVLDSAALVRLEAEPKGSE